MIKNLHGRKYERIPIASVAKITFSNQAQQSYSVMNMSLTGLFIVCDSSFLFDENCIVTLRDEWVAQKYSLTMSAKVTRLAKDGAGLQFTAMSPDTFMMLQTALLYLTNDPLGCAEEFALQCPVDIREQPDNILSELH